MDPGFTITAAVAGLAVGATRAPRTPALLFEGLGWAALGLVLSLGFT